MILIWALQLWVKKSWLENERKSKPLCIAVESPTHGVVESLPLEVFHQCRAAGSTGGRWEVG